MGEVKLSREELARRLKAARILMGKEDQEAFAKEVREAEGLGITTYGKLERGESDAQPMWLRSIAATLGVPDWWFSASTEELLAEDFPRERPDRLAHRLDRIEETLEQLAGTVLPSDEEFERYRRSRGEATEAGDEEQESPSDAQAGDQPRP